MKIRMLRKKGTDQQFPYTDALFARGDMEEFWLETNKPNKRFYSTKWKKFDKRGRPLKTYRDSSGRTVRFVSLPARKKIRESETNQGLCQVSTQ